MANLRDHLGRYVVAVIDIGVVTSFGVGKADSWAALSSCKSGIHPITSFLTGLFNTPISCMVDYLPSNNNGTSGLTYELAEMAALEPVEEADDFYRTRSKPDCSPAIAIIKATFADAGLARDDIDHVNPHGTSTPENEKVENLSLSTVFHEHIRKIPVSYNKSMIGHTLSTAGAVEAAFLLMTMREGVIPTTIN